MNFLEFRNKMFNLACFNIDQVYAWQPDFDRNNLSRWTKKGLLLRLRQGYFTFPEYRDKRDYAYCLIPFVLLGIHRIYKAVSILPYLKSLKKICICCIFHIKELYEYSI